MATINVLLCGVCDAQHVSKPARHWCPICEEGLCSECQKYHGASKLSRNHEIISIDNYNKLPPFIASIKDQCDKHNRKFQMYCPQHACPCCTSCISSNHSKCIGLVGIEDVIDRAKTSTLFENLEGNLKDMQLNIDTILSDRQGNIEKLNDQKQDFQKKIKQMRQDINGHLDKLERKLMTDLEDAEETVKSEIQNFSTELFAIKKTVDELQINMSLMKSYASNLQVFIGSKKIEDKVLKIEKYIHSIEEDIRLRQRSLECEINDKILDLLSISAFGSVSEISIDSFIHLQWQEKFQAFEKVSTREIENITLKPLHKWKIDCKGLTGCAVNSDGKIILADFDDLKLLILTKDGSLETIINFYPSHPCDVACIDRKTIAVSVYCPNRIQIIDTASKQTKWTFDTYAEIFGIEYTKMKISFCTIKSAIRTLHLLEKRAYTLVHPKTVSEWSGLARFNDKMYITYPEKHKVECYNENGERLWEFCDESVLSGPYGVTVDKHGNVYVASSRNSSIVFFSADGKRSKTLCKGDLHPRVVYFDNNTDTLMVVDLTGNICMYKETFDESDNALASN